MGAVERLVSSCTVENMTAEIKSIYVAFQVNALSVAQTD